MPREGATRAYHPMHVPLTHFGMHVYDRKLALLAQCVKTDMRVTRLVHYT